MVLYTLGVVYAYNWRLYIIRCLHNTLKTKFKCTLLLLYNVVTLQ